MNNWHGAEGITVKATADSPSELCIRDEVPADEISLEPHEELVFPKFKGVLEQYLYAPDGTKELRLTFADKEISFDEPELFSFGENIHRQARFAAETALSWGEGYEWPRIRDLLVQLMDEGVLFKAADPQLEELNPGGSRPSPLRPAETDRPRTWQECETVTAELTGRSLELAYLECAVPVFRVAHMYLDGDDRQVGEANVFPAALRLDRPTEWRSCPHMGSRYQDPKPMNVTALKAMRNYWPQMMVALRCIRAAYIRRFPRVADGWTVGDMQRFTSLVLALPAYLLMKSESPVPNGQLSPVLSCLFRVTDGVQMTTSIMLYDPTDAPTRWPDAPLAAADIFAYAEANDLFHTPTAVCAGPPAMIREFLRVLVDGKPIDGEDEVVLDPDVLSALKQLDAAFEYGFLGLQTYAFVYSLWPSMGQTCERLLAILEPVANSGTSRFDAFKQKLTSSLEALRLINGVDTDEWVRRRGLVYGDMYARSAEGLGKLHVETSLSRSLTYTACDSDASLLERLTDLLATRLLADPGSDAQFVRRLAMELLAYARLEQATVREVSRVQRCIGKVLGRPPAQGPLDASCLSLFYHLRGKTGHLPYVMDILRKVLEFDLVITPSNVDIRDLSVAAPRP